MSADSPSSDDPFDCAWRHEGLDAASVRLSGALDAARAPLLGLALSEALDHARLVLVDLHAVRSLDAVAARVMIDTSVRARETGRRVLVISAPPQAAALLTPAVETLSATASPLRVGAEPDAPENPVNDRVVAARVMALPAPGLWLHDAEGALRRAWAPALGPPAGASIDVYLTRSGALNGWHDPATGLAVNQRRHDGSVPASESGLQCHGPCGILWLTPAPAALLEHHERCLTCAGPLAPA